MTPTATRIAGIGALVASALLSGCAPAPAPTPTPTPLFASEDEAFAAAEETFDRYVDALNEVDTAHPESFEALFELSSGSVEKADRKNFSAMHAKNQRVEGATRVLSFEGLQSTTLFRTVIAAVCLDVSEVAVLNSDGSSAVNPERPDVYPLEVAFRASGSTALLVDEAEPSDEVQCPVS